VSTTAQTALHRVDLHTHSIHSDGTLSPSDLVKEANRRGLRVLGLTDHDTVDGLAEATAEADRLGMDLIPGVELSTVAPERGNGDHEVHLLGYFVDRDDLALRAGLASYAERRRDRVERIVERLQAAGVRIDGDRVRELAGPGTIGRPHVARALIEQGYVSGIAEAFDRYLAPGRPGYVPRPKVEPEQGIDLILEAGGVPVLAHPLGTGDVAATVAQLVPAGLAGIEVFYGEYNDEARRALSEVADRWQLIGTGGSDFHGPNFKPGRELGGPHVPAEVVERLRAATGRRTASGRRA